MKRALSISRKFLCIAILLIATNAFAQNLWTQKNDVPMHGRSLGLSFSLDTDGDGIADKGYIGGGWDQVSSEYQDFWEYNPQTDTWSQKANLGGGNRSNGASFALHGRGYICAGTASTSNFLNDCWQYNPANNSWAQKSSVRGPVRWGTFSTATDQRGYVGFGNSSSLTSPNLLNDLYSYNDTLDKWDTLASCPAGGRLTPCGFSLNGMLYLGMGWDGANCVNDFWSFNPSSNTWQQKTNFPGAGRQAASSFVVRGKGYLGMGVGNGFTYGFMKDFYEYNPTNDSWLSMQDYGGGLIDATCSFAIGDSGYIVSGYNGVVQTGVYKFVPFLNGYNTIRGKVYVDGNHDCMDDNGEQNLGGWIVMATPGPYFTSTDQSGNYVLRVAPGSYTVRQLSTLQQSLSIVTCPAGRSYSINFPSSGIDTSGFDFGDSVRNCPFLTIDVVSSGRRRCFNNLTVAHYCNRGFATAYNVQVSVKLPQYVSLVNTSIPYVYTADSTMVFSVDSVPAGQCGDIYITDIVSCANIAYLGLTACTEAWITPNNTCLPTDTVWNHADLDAKATCTSRDTVVLKITNIGSGDMTDSTAYRVYLDQTLVYIGKVKLTAGGSFSVSVASNGQTVRLEADQPAGHPFSSVAYAWNEGCGLDIPISVSKGYVDIFPTDDGEPQKSVNCITIDGAWDPNDKLVTPVGLTANHYVAPNTLLHYQVRFQNTGNASATNIVVVDTLSASLDPSTLTVTASSHQNTFAVSGNGRPILTFTFANINLPDSGTSQLLSQGFVSFTIRPFANTALGTVIDNKANIYFDNNPAVITNNVSNTISNYVQQDLRAHLDGTTLVLEGLENIMLPELGINLYPNPNDGKFTIGFDQSISGNIVISLTDMQGSVLWQRNTNGASSSSITVDAGNISKGVYLLNLKSANTSVAKKLIVE